MIARLATLSLAVAWLAACSTGTGNGAGPVAAETPCSEPRPAVCTMDYAPVCARLQSGARRGYSNACGACADPQVLAHLPGVCA